MNRRFALVTFAAVAPCASAQQTLFEVTNDDLSDTWSALIAVGDVNGDGVSDFAVNGAKVRVFSGADGAPLLTVDAAAWSLAGAGDVNQDGVPDLIAGMPTWTPFLDEGGSVRVHSGVDGAVIEQFDGPGGGVIGYSVDGGGDFTLDGVPDLLVARTTHAQAPPWIEDPEEVWMIAGGDFALVRTLTEPPIGLNDDNMLTTRFVGDVDGDGCVDVSFSMQDTPYWDTNQGSTRIYSGADGRLIRGLGVPGLFGMGYGVAPAGDVDGDGFAEVIIGAPQAGYDLDGVDGLAMVFAGASGEPLAILQGTHSYGYYGYDVAGGADLNGDGAGDYVCAEVSAPTAAGPMAGRIHVISSATATPLDCTIEGESSHLHLGQALALLSDVNSDGSAELAVMTQPDGGGNEVRVISVSGASPLPQSFIIGSVLFGSIAADDALDPEDRASFDALAHKAFRARVDVTSGDLLVEVAVLAPSGKLVRKWNVGPNAKAKWRKVALAANGSHTLRVRAIAGAGDYRIETASPKQPDYVSFERVKYGDMKDLRVAFKGIEGDMLEGVVEGIFGVPAAPTLALKPHGAPPIPLTPFVDMEFGDDSSFWQVPLPHSGRFELWITSPLEPGSKKAKAEFHFAVHHSPGHELLPMN